MKRFNSISLKSFSIFSGIVMAGVLDYIAKMVLGNEKMNFLVYTVFSLLGFFIGILISILGYLMLGMILMFIFNVIDSK